MASRAKRLEAINKHLEGLVEEHLDGALLTVSDELDSASTDVEELKDELQEWLDNMPENLQQSEKAEALQEAIDNLEEIESIISELVTEVDNFKSEFELRIEDATGTSVEFPGMFG